MFPAHVPHSTSSPNACHQRQEFSSWGGWRLYLLCVPIRNRSPGHRTHEASGGPAEAVTREGERRPLAQDLRPGNHVEGVLTVVGDGGRGPGHCREAGKAAYSPQEVATETQSRAGALRKSLPSGLHTARQTKHLHRAPDH